MGKVLFSHLCMSITIGVPFENSSDLNMGRRPELKSDEFLVVTAMVIEKIVLLCLKPLKRPVHLLGFGVLLGSHTGKIEVIRWENRAFSLVEFSLPISYLQKFSKNIIVGPSATRSKF